MVNRCYVSVFYFCIISIKPDLNQATHYVILLISNADFFLTQVQNHKYHLHKRIPFKKIILLVRNEGHCPERHQHKHQAKVFSSVGIRLNKYTSNLNVKIALLL